MRLDFDLGSLHFWNWIFLGGHGTFTWHESGRIHKPGGRRAVKAIRRPLLLATGWLSVALGVVGIIMPLFPTTPFLLVALWAFSRSSPEMAERIRSHRHAGKYVRDWENHGVIATGAKFIAVIMMTAMFGYLHLGTDAPLWIEIGIALVMAAAAGFVLTRPGRPAA